MNDVYCSTKFTELQVHIQGLNVSNCCKAYPERIDLDWLEQNPGKLFHTPTMIQDRTDMLSGKKCKSCDWGCYRYEAQGLSSERAKSTPAHINDVNHPLKKLKIGLSTDCNLTCVYCSSSFSNAWYRDIEKNGEYDVDGYQNQMDEKVFLWNKIKQKTRSNASKFFKLLLNEIKLTPSIEQINLLGGEPLLNNGLIELLETIKDKKIKIVSGLGITTDRLNKILNKIKDYDIEFIVSAETVGPLFEFIRYGEKWEDFQNRISLIKEAGHKIMFLSTITNISNFGLLKFYETFEGHDIQYNNVSNRSFLQPNVMDDTSKKQFLDSIKGRLNISFFKQLYDSTSQPHTDQQKQSLKKFLVEFARRRNLSLAIFPKHFLNWLEII